MIVCERLIEERETLRKEALERELLARLSVPCSAKEMLEKIVRSASDFLSRKHVS